MLVLEVLEETSGIRLDGARGWNDSIRERGMKLVSMNKKRDVAPQTRNEGNEMQLYTRLNRPRATYVQSWSAHP